MKSIIQSFTIGKLVSVSVKSWIIYAIRCPLSQCN